MTCDIKTKGRKCRQPAELYYRIGSKDYGVCDKHWRTVCTSPAATVEALKG